MATIGSIAVNITASTVGVQKAVQKTQAILGGFVSKVSLLGAAVAAPFAAALRSFESTGSELHDLSTATGIAVDKLSFLKYAAEQSSTSLEAITKAARELQDKGIDPNKFEEIAARIAGIKDPTERAQAAFAKFGKKAGFPILKLIKDIPELKKRFEQLGGGFTSRMADQADKLGDAWGDVKFALSNVRNEISMALAPSIIKLSNYIAENGKNITKWVENHQDLVKNAAFAAAGLAALTPVIFTLGTFLNPVVLMTGAIAVSLGLAAKGFYDAYYASQTFLDGLKALMNVVSPFLGAMQALGVFTGAESAAGFGLGNSPVASAPPATAPPTAPPTDTAVAKNTAITNDLMSQLLAKMDEMNGRKQPGQAPQRDPEQFHLVTTGVR